MAVWEKATSFEVSLSNSQMDAKINPNGHWDYSWDAVWESGTHFRSAGMARRIRHPISAFRYPLPGWEESPSCGV